MLSFVVEWRFYNRCIILSLISFIRLWWNQYDFVTFKAASQKNEGWRVTSLPHAGMPCCEIKQARSSPKPECDVSDSIQKLSFLTVNIRASLFLKSILWESQRFRYVYCPVVGDNFLLNTCFEFLREPTGQISNAQAWDFKTSPSHLIPRCMACPCGMQHSQ